jgi:hypothetical protein
MEGCGIKAGDQFLQTELGAIMRSPAWRTQRSLAIITFDEDGYDHEHPAQRVLTLMLGSGVRQGYVSTSATPTTACSARSRPRSAWVP